jgi:hypothetical protein
MTVPAPYALPATSAWQLIDWVDNTYNAIADATGVALITLPSLPSDTRWQLTHAVAGCASAAQPVMRLYLDSVGNPNLRDGTNTGIFDVADWPMGLMVPPGRSLLARWTGCNVGDQAFLNLQANVLRQSA